MNNMTKKSTTEIANELRLLSAVVSHPWNELTATAAVRLENQSATINNMQKYMEHMRLNLPEIHRVTLDEIKQNTAISDQPSEEIEGDWV